MAEKESQDNTERSAQIIELMKAAIGQSLKNLPVAPLTQWLNGQIQQVKRGEVSVSFEVREEMTNPTAILHGGIICAMLDDVIGMSSATLGDAGFLLSIDFHVDYLGKAKQGDTVTATGTIIREGHRIVHAEAQLKDSQDKLIATANSNLLRTKTAPDFIQRFHRPSKDKEP